MSIFMVIRFPNKWMLDDGGKSSVGLFGVQRPPRQILVVMTNESSLGAWRIPQTKRDTKRHSRLPTLSVMGFPEIECSNGTHHPKWQRARRSPAKGQ